MARWLYTCVIRPMITYGSLVWWHKMETRRYREQMTKLQRQGCLLITGSMRSTPTVAMEALLDILPLHLFVEKTAMEVAYRLNIVGMIRSNSKGGYLEIFNRVDRVVELMMPSDLIVTETMLERKYMVVTGTARRMEAVKMKRMPNGINIYTDGSKTALGSGSGVWSKQLQGLHTSISLGKGPTVFQAEVFAILAGSQILIEKGLRGKTINFLSDSLAACHALQRTEVASRLVKECRTFLNTLAASNRVIVKWIPGHVGIHGNEMADRLARRGSEILPVGPRPFCGVAPSSARAAIEEIARRKFKRLWDSSHIRHTKKFVLEPTSRLWKELKHMPRVEVRMLTGIITGHCEMNKHLHTMKIVDSSTCRWCGLQEETPEHVICQCDHLDQTRFRLVGQVKIDKETSAQLSLKELRGLVKELKFQ